MHRLLLLAHCGMIALNESFDTHAEARRMVATILRTRRKEGFQVTTLTSGATWELTEPADAALVPDDAGILTLTRDYTVSVWDERDRLHIAVTCGDEEVADWWDDDAREMFEQGFFDRRKLKSSVIDYCRDHGIIKEAA